MRWEDERYVRVYTRDTPEWCLLSWEARGIFVLLLRVVDRAGILQLGRSGPRAVAALLRAPADVVERALSDLEADGCVLIRDGALIIPNFQAAQEARQSDKARAAKAREKARATAGFVTPCDDTSRHDTEPSHEVTPRHTASLRAVPCCADSAPTERVTAEPPPALPEVSQPEQGPALPAHAGGHGQLGLVGCGPETISPKRGRGKGTKGPQPVRSEPDSAKALLGIAWGTWRAAYRAKYRKSYSQSSADPSVMQRAISAALAFLEQEGRSRADLEALMAHRWKRYLDDPGQAKVPGAKGFLQDNSHALQFFERNVATYGSPWDREAQQPAIRAAPLREVQPALAPALPPPGLAQQVGRAGLGGTGQVVSRPVASQEGVA